MRNVPVSDQLEMTADSPHEVTQLLLDWSSGDQAALDRLLPLVDRELHRLAHHYMRRENPGHTLQTTALVNEAYLKLIDQKNVHWKNRAHFFALAAQLMRRILVDHARRRQYAKRGGGAHKVSLDDAMLVSPKRGGDLIALDEALDRLAAIDPRKGKIVELRFFGGLSVDETAEALQISSVTVMREWSMAKAWLYNSLSNET
ncbi:MAG: sigma-70 family RNA polymerase sigma factor [Pyrinomonadaceae bacterium]